MPSPSNHSLFGTDGIRGKPGEYPLKPVILGGLGASFRKLLEKHHLVGRRHPSLILWARDTRGSGPALLRELVRGFSGAGFTCLDCGVLPTPAMAYLGPSAGAVLAGVISASHNPPEYNGVKFFGPTGKKISQEWEEEVQQGLSGLGSPSRSLPARAAPFVDSRRRYQDFLRSQVPVDLDFSGIKVVVDGANGAVCRVLPPVLAELGARMKVLGSVPNGKNINAGCGAMDPSGLQRAVLREKADIGFAFDGDGDRLVVVDEKGRILAGEWIMASVALDRRRQGQPGSGAVVTTQVSNLALKYFLEGQGINLFETKVGDRWVLQKLEQEGLGFGGENSGHFIFANRLPSADASLASLLLLSMMKRRGRPASQTFVRFSLLNQVSIQIPAASGKPALETLPSFLGELAQVSKILDHRGRALVRYSGTEPVLRILLEGSLPKSKLQAMATNLKNAYQKAVQ